MLGEQRTHRGESEGVFQAHPRHEVQYVVMARDLRQMFREAFELAESDRATLAGLLIESLEPPPDPEVEELWAQEAERRWQEIEGGSAQTIPWEEVRAKLFRRA
jgi:putative addiction module component (TIGR02574 family)